MEASHMISILVYLLDNDGCRKSDIYRDVCYSSLMPEKLKVLEDEGLITEDVWNRAVLLRLTAKGRAVAEHFADVRDIMDTERLRLHPICRRQGMEGRKRKGRSGTDVFEASHMITALIYLLDHDGCRKTDLYRAADRSCLMPKKLVILQDAGMVTLVAHPGMTTVHLTDRGRKVAEHFAEVAAIMGPDRRMRRVRVTAFPRSSYGSRCGVQ